VALASLLDGQERYLDVAAAHGQPRRFKALAGSFDGLDALKTVVVGRDNGMQAGLPRKYVNRSWPRLILADFSVFYVWNRCTAGAGSYCF
jgi:hypothetical protein